MKELSSNTAPPDKINEADKNGQQANKMATAPITGSRNSASLRIFGKAAFTVGTQACDIRFPDGDSFYTFKKSRGYRMVDFSDCRNFNGDILRNIFNRCDK